MNLGGIASGYCLQLGTKGVASSSRVFAVKVQVILHSTGLWLEELMMETDPFTHRSLIQFQIKATGITLSAELNMGFYLPFKVLYSARFEAADDNPWVSGCAMWTLGWPWPGSSSLNPSCAPCHFWISSRAWVKRAGRTGWNSDLNRKTRHTRW